jgi:PAS domain S-box-containing protein
MGTPATDLPQQELAVPGIAPELFVGICTLLLAIAVWLWVRQRRQQQRVEAQVRLRTLELSVAHRQLAASEARSRAVFELGLVGLAELATDTAIVRCNGEFAAMLGVAREGLTGTRFLQLVEEADRAEVRAGADALSRGAAERHVAVLRVVGADGVARRARLALRAVTGDDGAVEQLLAVLVDLTEILGLVEGLQVAKEQAEAATRAKSEFLANMSHEIRTPITAILGYTDMLREEEQSPDVVQAIDVIQRNGKHLLVILNDILDLSKIEARKLHVESLPFALLPLLDDVHALLRARAIEKGIGFDVVGEGAVPLQLTSDPTRLRQILTNLVGNAIKFTDDGSVTIAVGLVPAEPRPLLEVHVRDTGIGMTAEQQASLFQPFVQADNSTSRRFGGTGLGLAISHRLAGMLGGALRVASAPGRGTTFTLTLDPGALDPAQCAATLDDARARSRALPKVAAPGDPQQQRPCRVLVAEDGPDNQRLLRALLTKAGHTLEIVDNGQLALDAIAQAREAGEPFDVVVMDMQMPVLDGYGAVRALRAQGDGVPVIACTAHAMAEERDKCLAAGCSDYTTKPIDRRDLLKKVARWTTRSPADGMR